MYTNDNYVSPYLRRPPGSQQQVARQQTRQDRREMISENGSPNRKATGDVDLSR